MIANSMRPAVFFDLQMMEAPPNFGYVREIRSAMQLIRPACGRDLGTSHFERRYAAIP